MKRILILGSSGSGKSKFSRKLGALLNIEIIHLDSYFWKPNWEMLSKEEWNSILEKLLKKNNWIMDGNYLRTLDLRLQYADTAIFLDFNRYFCMIRCISRFFKHSGKNRPDMCVGCNEKFDWEFARWIWNYPRDIKPRVFDLLNKYSDKVDIQILRSKKQIDRFLNDIKK